MLVRLLHKILYKTYIGLPGGPSPSDTQCPDDREVFEKLRLPAAKIQLPSKLTESVCFSTHSQICYMQRELFSLGSFCIFLPMPTKKGVYFFSLLLPPQKKETINITTCSFQYQSEFTVCPSSQIFALPQWEAWQATIFNLESLQKLWKLNNFK